MLARISYLVKHTCIVRIYNDVCVIHYDVQLCPQTFPPQCQVLTIIKFIFWCNSEEMTWRNVQLHHRHLNNFPLEFNKEKKTISKMKPKENV